jgi:hypothetical protein
LGYPAGRTQIIAQTQNVKFCQFGVVFNNTAGIIKKLKTFLQKKSKPLNQQNDA